ncbi:MAG: STAS domain-containing protein [Methylotenera sp.]|nr:STAS domain-containing protein [Methylotenera sp.]MSP99582.1 STAS domain-containing protein [Methylotenera sp.]
MTHITPPNIVQHDNKWHISGDVLMDNSNVILLKSESLSMRDEFVVDFAEVTKVDTVALSLMMEWQRRAVAASATVSFAHLPLNLSRLLVLYGVAEFIPLSIS